MASVNEIDKSIKKILGNYKISNQKSINQYLSQILQEDEKIIAFMVGSYESKNMNLLTTNKRVIIFNKGLIRCTQVEIPIEKINSIGKHKGLLLGTVEIWDSSSKIVITNVPKNQIDLFVKSTNEEINNYKSFKVEVNKTVEEDILDKIGKLSELHKSGVLTDYEFSTKKVELLEKLKK